MHRPRRNSSIGKETTTKEKQQQQEPSEERSLRSMTTTTKTKAQQHRSPRLYFAREETTSRVDTFKKERKDFEDFWRRKEKKRNLRNFY